MSSFNNPILERIFANRDRQEQQANFEAEQNRLRSASAQAFKINSESNKLRREMEVADLARESAEKRVAEAKLKQDNASAQRVFEASVNLGPGDVPNLDNAVRNLREVPIHEQRGGDTIFTAYSPGGLVEFSTQEVSRNRLNAQAEAQRAQDFASQGVFYKEDAKAQAQDPFKREKAEATSNLRLVEIIAKGDQARQTMREKLALQGKEKVLASELGEGEKTLYGSFRTGDAEPSRGKQGIIERDRFSTLFPGQVPMPKLVKKQLIEIDKQIFPLEQMEQIMSRYPDIFTENQALATVRGGVQRLLDMVGFSEFQKELKSLFAISPQVAKGLGEDRLTELDIQRTIGAMIDGGLTKKQALENIVRFKQRAINATKASRGAVPEFQVYEQYPNIAAVAKSLRSATEKQKPKEKGALTFSPEVEASLAAAAEEAGLDAQGAAALRRRYATIQGQQ